MPRKEIDYSRTVFYSIRVRGETVPFFIGYTTNLPSTKQNHKRALLSHTPPSTAPYKDLITHTLEKVIYEKIEILDFPSKIYADRHIQRLRSSLKN